MSFDPLFITVAMLVVVLTGISKAGFGAGVEMTAVPVMALFIAPQAAAAIMLPILIMIDIANLWRYRRTWDRYIVAIMIPAAIIGIAIGALTFRYLDADLLRLALGLLALSFVVQRLLFHGPKDKDDKPGLPFTAIFSAMSGFTSFIAHAGGPPAKMVLLRHRFEKQRFVGTNSYLFASINALKLPPYIWLGQFTTENLTGTLVLAPAVPVGICIGFWLHQLVSERLFTVLIFSALTATGLKLLWDGLSAIM